jgi:hypothetical protein
MQVDVDQAKHQVILTGDCGMRTVLGWSAALVLGGLLKDASVQAEPAALPGRSYCPTTERTRV